MEFIVRFDTDSASFGEDDAAMWTAQTQAVLRHVADSLDTDAPRDGQIRDLNGNRIGHFCEQDEGDIWSLTGGQLLDYGFGLIRVAGSSSAWAYTLPDGRQILITDENGSHVVVTRWLLGIYEADGNATDSAMFEFEPSDRAGLMAKVRELVGG